MTMTATTIKALSTVGEARTARAVIVISVKSVMCG